MNKKKDMYARAKKVGISWFAVFKTPGRRARFVKEDGQRKRFDTEAQAIQAAADVMCEIFADRTLGIRDVDVLFSRRMAEDKLFGSKT